MKGLPIALMIIVLSLLVFPRSSDALQQVAGKLTIEVASGESGIIGYGLINDKAEPVIVKLRSEGSSSEFLSFPSEVILEPGKLTFVNITSSIPGDYSGQNILEGFIYALEGSEGGQIQLSVQMKKQIELIIPEGKGGSEDATGLITSESQPLLLGVLTLIILLSIITLIKKRR